MQRETAETIARTTRDEAERQAHDDLDQLRRQAVGAGRERSRNIVKVTMINTVTSAISYNPAGRLLRDWYLHVYINSLRHNLSQPCEVIDRQQADAAAALLEGVRPGVDAELAQQVVGVGRDLAEMDGAAAAAGITEMLHEAAPYRAMQHAPDGRFDNDQLRTHVSRHWYRRCYEAVADESVSGRHPLAPVTDAETLEVARVLESRDARRILGWDGIPLVGGRAMTAAAVAERVKHAWSDMDEDQRAEWLSVTEAVATPTSSDWARLDNRQQVKLIRNYLDRCRADIVAAAPIQRRVDDSGADVASRLFNHPTFLMSQHWQRELDSLSLGLGAEDVRPRADDSVERRARNVR